MGVTPSEPRLCAWTGPSRLSAGRPRHAHSCSDRMADNPPAVLLAEADRLAWLHNWLGRGRSSNGLRSFSCSQETPGTRFTARSAACGRMSIACPSSRLPTTSARAAKPLVQHDSELKMRLLVVKGNIDLEIDPPNRGATGSRCSASLRNSARGVGRAGRGELAILAFLEGDAATARSMMTKAVILARLYGMSPRRFATTPSSARASSRWAGRRRGSSIWTEPWTLRLNTRRSRLRCWLKRDARRRSSAESRSEAEAALNQILERARQTNRTDYEADLHARLGILKAQANETQSAIAHLEQAAVLARRTQVYRIEATANCNWQSSALPLVTARGRERARRETGCN